MDRVRGGEVRGEGEDDEKNKRSLGRDSEESSIYGLPFYGDSARWRRIRTRAERRGARREERGEYGCGAKGHWGRGGRIRGGRGTVCDSSRSSGRGNKDND